MYNLAPLGIILRIQQHVSMNTRLTRRDIALITHKWHNLSKYQLLQRH